MTNEMKTPGGVMTLEDFEALVGTYGADPARWPAGEREDAQSFLMQSDEAQGVLAEALMLDQLLDQAPGGETYGALTARIMATAPGGEAEELSLFVRIGRALWPQTGIARPAALLGASLALGIYMGASGASANVDTYSYEESDSDLFAYVFDVSDDWSTDEGEDM